jgi:hypothetical protein
MLSGWDLVGYGGSTRKCDRVAPLWEPRPGSGHGRVPPARRFGGLRAPQRGRALPAVSRAIELQDCPIPPGVVIVDSGSRTAHVRSPLDMERK